MNGYLFLAFCIVGVIVFVYEIGHRRTPKLLTILLCVLFVFTVVSRQYGYKEYSDLGAYIWRFVNDDNAYFSEFYGKLADGIRLIFGSSVNGFLISISLIILSCALATVLIMNKGAKREKRQRYIGTFIFLFGLYWGMSFSAEVIRSGLAISFSMVAVALLLSPFKIRRLIAATIMYVIALMIHWTQIILLPFLLYILLVRRVKNRPFRFYFLFTVLMLFLDLIDFSRIVLKGSVPLFQKFINAFGGGGHYDGYFEVVQRSNPLDYLTRQYIYYHVLGLVFAFFKLKDIKYIKLLNGYYFGLSLFTLFNGISTAITRTQWPLLILSVLLMYKLVRDGLFSQGGKLVTFAMYSGTQGLLSSLYLGLRF